jgi:hypothetical protein
MFYKSQEKSHGSFCFKFSTVQNLHGTRTSAESFKKSASIRANPRPISKLYGRKVWLSPDLWRKLGGKSLGWLAGSVHGFHGFDGFTWIF